MFSTVSLLAFVTLALSVAATPVIHNRSPFTSIPISKAPISVSGHDLVSYGIARAQNFRDQQSTARDLGESKKRQLSVPADNTGTSYLASVNIGNPPTEYQLIVDTGSSNTWVGAGQPYKDSLTSESTGDSVSVSYGSGQFSGTEYTDFVNLGSGLVIAGQSIGAASSSSGFGSGVDGILGIGPTDLTEGTVENQDEVPTVTDSLYEQGTIFNNVVGISFEPITSAPTTNGELTFGGTDPSKYEGDIVYTPRVGNYWGIEQSITYNGETIQDVTTGIVDTTTLLILSTEVLNKYISAVGAVFDNSVGLYAITADQYSGLQDLVFNIGGADFTLTPNAQIWPRSLNSDIGGTADGIYLIVADNGPATNNGDGTDVNFLNGQVFLERFYSVYDTGNSQVGIANTPFTSATTN